MRISRCTAGDHRAALLCACAGYPKAPYPVHAQMQVLQACLRVGWWQYA